MDAPHIGDDDATPEVPEWRQELMGSTMCIDCGETIPEDDVESDPETGEGPLCPDCLECREEEPDFDFGERDEFYD